jgi:hypothetical protein
MALARPNGVQAEGVAVAGELGDVAGDDGDEEPGGGGAHRTYDRRGFGRSDKPKTPTSYTYDKLTEDLRPARRDARRVLDRRHVDMPRFLRSSGP